MTRRGGAGGTGGTGESGTAAGGAAEPETAGGETAGAETVTVYTDGGASPNPGPGGWAAVLLRPGADPEELSGGEPATTNNRMELTAAIRALAALPPGAKVHLHTDSRYLRQGITAWLPGWVARGWTRKGGGRVENEDLWRRLASLAHDRTVRWSWVRGHAGDRWNERADRLASAAIRRQQGRGRRPGAPGGGPGEETAAAAPDVEVWLKVSASGGHGGWAALLRRRAGEDEDGGRAEAGERAADVGLGRGESGEERMLSGSVAPVSANRLDLVAAAEVLDGLPEGTRVAVHTGSDYLRNGATSWITSWRRRGWKTKEGKPVANREEWERLAAAAARRRVAWPRPGDEDEETAEIWKALERRAREAREEGS